MCGINNNLVALNYRRRLVVRTFHLSYLSMKSKSWQIMISFNSKITRLIFYIRIEMNSFRYIGTSSKWQQQVETVETEKHLLEVYRGQGVLAGWQIEVNRWALTSYFRPTSPSYRHSKKQQYLHHLIVFVVSVNS